MSDCDTEVADFSLCFATQKQLSTQKQLRNGRNSLSTDIFKIGLGTDR